MAFVKGQSGNPGGKTAKPWADALRMALKQFESPTVQQGTALRAIAEKCIAKAIEGDKDSITELANRLDGKPHQSVDVDATVAGQIIVQMASKDADI